MQKVMLMAGHYASKALSDVSSGETLLPIVGYLTDDGNQSMERLAMGSADAMSTGQNRLNNLSVGQQGVALITDTLVTLDTGKTDSLLINMRFNDNASHRLSFMLPYRHASNDEGFAVHRLKVVECQGIDQADVESLTESFFEGLESHDQGGEIWRNQYVHEAGQSNGVADENYIDFSEDDFAVIVKSPLLIFFLVALADGRVDKKEILAFADMLSDATLQSDPLFNRIITNIAHDMQNMIYTLLQGDDDPIEELKKVREIIDRMMPLQDANNFKMKLLYLGKKIAEASGGGFFGLGNKISKEERTALAGILVTLGIQME